MEPVVSSSTIALAAAPFPSTQYVPVNPLEPRYFHQICVFPNDFPFFLIDLHRCINSKSYLDRVANIDPKVGSQRTTKI